MNSTDDSWNVSKHKTKSADKSCLYKQVFNINPLMGGFSVFGDTLNTSTFNVYQFTGQYKIGANGNNVVLTTTSSCSQDSVSFYRALVVFQQKVTPEKRETRCKQEVVFNENKYTIIINPFEQHDIDVGTMITASNGTISYTTFKLPSKTNQTKIAQALFDYLYKTNVPPVVDDSILNVKSIKPSQIMGTGPDKVLADIEVKPFVQTLESLPSFSMKVYVDANSEQAIELPTSPPAGMPSWATFLNYIVVPAGGSAISPRSDGRYYLHVGAYTIGYVYIANGSRILAGAYFNAFINVAVNTVTPVVNPIDTVA